jgi:hypothetical protein
LTIPSDSPSFIPLQIRRIIFENFNDPDIRFTNDEVFDILQKEQSIDKSLTIDDMEPYFDEISTKGLVRNIAQNFTTIWFKLFDTMEKIHCPACDNDVYLGGDEDKICPNSSCNSKM